MTVSELIIELTGIDLDASGIFLELLMRAGLERNIIISEYDSTRKFKIDQVRFDGENMELVLDKQ